MIEFLRRSSSFDILRVKPHECSLTERFRDWSSSTISGALVLFLGDSDLFTTIVVKFGELSREIVSVRISYRNV